MPAWPSYLLLFLLLGLPGSSLASPTLTFCDDSGKVYKICSDQKVVFAQALESAKKEGKLLVVVLGAEWCPWCHSLDELLRDRKFARGRGKGFQLSVIALYAGRDPHPSGQSVLERLRLLAGVKEKVAGIPLLALVNPKRNKAVFIPTEPLEKNTEKTKGHDAEKVFAALDRARERVR